MKTLGADGLLNAELFGVQLCCAVYA